MFALPRIGVSVRRCGCPVYPTNFAWDELDAKAERYRPPTVYALLRRKDRNMRKSLHLIGPTWCQQELMERNL